MVCFLEELKHVPPSPTPVKTKTPVSSQATPVPLAVHSQDEAPTPTPQSPTNTILISHVMNLMKLGSFDHELEFHDQEQIIEKILELCPFYGY